MGWGSYDPSPIQDCWNRTLAYTSTNLLENTAQMMHAEKHIHSLCINLMSPTFLSHRFSDWFSPLLHYLLCIGIVDIWKKKRILSTLLIFKDQNFEWGFWLSVFSSIGYFQTGNYPIMRIGAYMKIRMWCHPCWTVFHISQISHCEKMVQILHSVWKIGTKTSRISYQYFTFVKFAHVVKLYVAYMHSVHIYKIPPKSAAFCIRFQFFIYICQGFITWFKQVTDKFHMFYSWKIWDISILWAASRENVSLEFMLQIRQLVSM